MQGTIDLSAWQVTLTIGWPVIVAILVIVGAWRYWRYKQGTEEYEVQELTIEQLGIAASLKPNREICTLAYQTWVELRTRKAALPFDPDHDVIVEVYRSLYELFGVLREITKRVPAHRLRQSPDTRTLVNVTVAILNDAIRPHLTRWQAEFRHWYNNAYQANGNARPQDVQKQFPRYSELVHNLTEVNQELQKYADWLERIVYKSKG